VSGLRASINRRPLLSAYLLFAALAAAGRPASWKAPPGGDLGQYMYAGGVVLDGGFPYVDAANNKGPANFLLFALLRLVCGRSPELVRVAFVLVTALAALAVAGYVAHYAGRAAGLLAGVTMALLSSAFGFEGFDPNNAQFGLVPMAGAWYFATTRDRRGTTAAGALAAFAFWMNPAFGVALPFVAWELWRGEDRGRRLALALAGGAAVTVPLLLWLAVGGALDDMATQVFGKVQQTLTTGGGGAAPGAFGGAGPGLEGPQAPLQFLLDLPNPLLWMSGLAGCAVAARVRELRPAAVAAALWILAGWLRVEVASYDFANQYAPVLVGIAAGIALGVASVWPRTNGARAGLAALVLAAPVWAAVAEPQLRQLALPAEARGNAIAVDLADYVERTTQPGSRIVVAEFDPQVYWLSDRRAVSRFFDSFGLAGRDEYVAERRRDLFERPPAAVAAVPDRFVDPDLQELLDTRGYVLVYDRDGARVWLADQP
jgi:hypothetical protein